MMIAEWVMVIVLGGLVIDGHPPTNLVEIRQEFNDKTACEEGLKKITQPYRMTERGFGNNSVRVAVCIPTKTHESTSKHVSNDNSQLSDAVKQLIPEVSTPSQKGKLSFFSIN